jgi:hypothetical protein
MVVVMKKVLFIFLTLFGLLFFPKGTLAQEGTFGCRWESRGCGVDYGGATCGATSQVDVSYCGQFSHNREACENAARAECLPILSCSGLGGTCTVITKKGCGTEAESEGRQDCDPSYICCVPISESKKGKAEEEGAERVLCDDGNGIRTALGCIPINDTNKLIGFILSWLIGIGGGVAFLLIIFAAFQIMTSSGNPDRLKAGQELMTSAIAGLILLIFSVFILRIIGVNILGILPEV